MSLFRIIKSEFLKMKGTYFYLMHVGFPVLGALLCIFYYRKSTLDTGMMLSNSMMLILLVFPIAISIVTSMVMEEEAKAGNFRVILSSLHGRNMQFAGKAVFLCSMGIGAYLLIVLLLGNGLEILHNTKILTIMEWGILFGATCLPVICMYFFHMFLAMKFGLGLSIGLGILEFMIEALFMTGLGDGIWSFVPCSMPVRINNILMMIFLDSSFENLKLCTDLRRSLSICMVYLISMIVFGSFWLRNFSGRNQSE